MDVCGTTGFGRGGSWNLQKLLNCVWGDINGEKFEESEIGH